MLKIDLHIHTLVSGDSQNTYKEYIDKAVENGMDMIGFSEHGPNSSHSHFTHEIVSTFKRYSDNIKNIKVLTGIEANIIKENGSLDIERKTLSKLDYVIAMVHGDGKEYNQKTEKDKNTNAIVNAIRSGKVHILSHPFYTGYVPYDVDIVFEEACKNNVLLEVDLYYIKAKINDGNTYENLKKMIEMCKKYKKKVIVNSDAHNIYEMGDDSHLERIKEDIGLTDDMIINNYKDELLKFLGVEI